MMSERDRFEKWLTSTMFCSADSTDRTADGMYYNTVAGPIEQRFSSREYAAVQLLWMAWQAARKGGGE